MSVELDVVLRGYRETDRNLVLATYLKSFADSYFARGMLRPVYFKGQEAVARQRLIPASEGIMAHLPEDEDAVIGWCLMGGGALHYVFVKPAFRKMGVAKMLLLKTLPLVPMAYTHRTDMCSLLPIPESWKYDPYPMINAGT